jgi:hypothetical protein
MSSKKVIQLADQFIMKLAQTELEETKPGLIVPPRIEPAIQSDPISQIAPEEKLTPPGMPSGPDEDAAYNIIRLFRLVRNDIENDYATLKYSGVIEYIDKKLLKDLAMIWDKLTDLSKTAPNEAGRSAENFLQYCSDNIPIILEVAKEIYDAVAFFNKKLQDSGETYQITMPSSMSTLIRAYTQIYNSSELYQRNPRLRNPDEFITRSTNPSLSRLARTDIDLLLLILS